MVSPGGNYGAATWTGITVVPEIDNTTISNAWLAANIQQGHGPLGAAYPDVTWRLQGDTPSWLNHPPVPVFDHPSAFAVQSGKGFLLSEPCVRGSHGGDSIRPGALPGALGRPSAGRKGPNERMKLTKPAVLSDCAGFAAYPRCSADQAVFGPTLRGRHRGCRIRRRSRAWPHPIPLDESARWAGSVAGLVEE